MQREFADALLRSRFGDTDAARAALSEVYLELRRIARRSLAGSRRLATLGTTALVNEAYLRLLADSARRIESRAHFLNLASKVMRQLVCDHARRRAREHRLIEREALAPEMLEQVAVERTEVALLTSIDTALSELEALDARQVRVVECKYFVGLTSSETAAALGMSLRSVERAWTQARAWLAARLETVA
jgi:RNA polymerase sigma factor (TIGR02999 family)